LTIYKEIHCSKKSYPSPITKLNTTRHNGVWNSKEYLALVKQSCSINTDSGHFSSVRPCPSAELNNGLRKKRTKQDDRTTKTTLTAH